MSWEIKKLATDVAYKAVGSLEGAGIFAVELFLTEDGQVVSSMLTLLLNKRNHVISIFILLDSGTNVLLISFLLTDFTE